MSQSFYSFNSFLNTLSEVFILNKLFFMSESKPSWYWLYGPKLVKGSWRQPMKTIIVSNSGLHSCHWSILVASEQAFYPSVSHKMFLIKILPLLRCQPSLEQCPSEIKIVTITGHSSGTIETFNLNNSQTPLRRRNQIMYLIYYVWRMNFMIIYSLFIHTT